jgi:hypothetical protein
MSQRERTRPGPVGEIFLQYPDCALVSATSGLRAAATAPITYYIQTYSAFPRSLEEPGSKPGSKAAAWVFTLKYRLARISNIPNGRKHLDSF